MTWASYCTCPHSKPCAMTWPRGNRDPNMQVWLPTPTTTPKRPATKQLKGLISSLFSSDVSNAKTTNKKVLIFTILPYQKVKASKIQFSNLSSYQQTWEKVFQQKGLLTPTKLMQCSIYTVNRIYKACLQILLTQHKGILITNASHFTKRLQLRILTQRLRSTNNWLFFECREDKERGQVAVSWRLKGCCPFSHPIQTSGVCLNQPITSPACFNSHYPNTSTHKAWREEIKIHTPNGYGYTPNGRSRTSKQAACAHEPQHFTES